MDNNDKTQWWWWWIGIIIIAFAVQGLWVSCAHVYDHTLGTYARDMQEIRKDINDLTQRVMAFEPESNVVLNDGTLTVYRDDLFLYHPNIRF